MKVKKLIDLAIGIGFLCLLAGIGAFVYNSQHSYNISRDFNGVPLQFDPVDASSTYPFDQARVTVYGGFIKGIQKDKTGHDSLVIRALSPLPNVTVQGTAAGTVTLLLENINPDFYAESTTDSKLEMSKTTVNTLKINVPVDIGKTITINPVKPTATDPAGRDKYIILGDNRDGYDTFGQIIQQVNAAAPVFVIDNGDLVFSGKPNQYRLFDQTVSKLGTTLLTAPGNHDIRGNGRTSYTKLYGPVYYSFDFADSHFVFLDSAPGWAQKQAITEEQYIWLEKDLKKAAGKRIFVTTHIPPHDPRGGVTTNEIPNYMSEVKTDDNWLEQKLNNYSESKSMYHGFQDPLEADRFERLMTAYGVDTVYLSHIHSYLEYTRDGVRYLITGGAGAELLTTTSYYHYLISSLGEIIPDTIVELPSPASNYLSRYGATIQLFAKAMYEENPLAMIFLLAGVGLLLSLVIVKLVLRKQQGLQALRKWLGDSWKYSVKRFRELFPGKKSS